MCLKHVMDAEVPLPRMASNVCIDLTPAAVTGAKKQKQPLQVTREPINLALVRRVCGMRASVTIKLDNGKLLRDHLYTYITRADIDASMPDIGWITVVWGASAFDVATEKQGRRESGKSWSDLPEHMKVGMGWADGNPPALPWATRSVFCSNNSKMIRNILRAGIDFIVDVDQDASNQRVLLTRYPDAQHLRTYCENKDLIRAETPPNASAAKELYNRLMCLGSVRGWREETDFHGALPDFVDKFAEEMTVLANRDVERFPQLFAFIQSQVVDDKDPRASLMAHLNQHGEREVLDKVIREVRGLAVVGAYEHDGALFVGKNDSGEAWRLKVLAIARTVAPHSIKPFPSPDAALEALQARYPGDWTTDPSWEAHSRACFDFSMEFECGYTRNHKTAAAVISTSSYYGTGFSVKDVFKVTFDAEKNKPTLIYYDFEAQHWRTASEATGKMKLKRGMQETLKAVIGKNITPQFLTDGHYLNMVVDSIMPDLVDMDFMESLDNEASRRYVQFEGAVFDRETWTTIPPHPNLRISNCTGYPYKAFEDKYEFGAFLQKMVKLPNWEAALATEELSFDRSEAMVIGKAAEELLKHMPVLKVVYSVTESWLSTIYLLAHFSRALLGLDWFEEFLIWYGAGKNGKDMLQTWFRTIFGGYAQVIDGVTLCKEIDSTRPQPSLRRLYGKRFVYCSEVLDTMKFSADTMKKLRDQRGAQISARFLNENDLVFHPSFLLCVCFNDDRDFDRYDGGVLRSLVKQNFPFFHCQLDSVTNPPGHYRAVNTDLKSEKYIMEHSAETIFLLLEVFKVCLRDQPRDTQVKIGGFRPAEVDEVVNDLARGGAGDDGDGDGNGNETQPVDSDVLKIVKGYLKTEDGREAERSTKVKSLVRAVCNCSLTVATSKLASIGFVEKQLKNCRVVYGKLAGEEKFYYLKAKAAP